MIGGTAREYTKRKSWGNRKITFYEDVYGNFHQSTTTLLSASQYLHWETINPQTVRELMDDQVRVTELRIHSKCIKMNQRKMKNSRRLMVNHMKDDDYESRRAAIDRNFVNDVRGIYGMPLKQQHQHTTASGGGGMDLVGLLTAFSSDLLPFYTDDQLRICYFFCESLNFCIINESSATK